MTGLPPRLVFLLVHGIGPQGKDLHRPFLDKVYQETQRHLRRAGRDDLAGGLADRLTTVPADWSELFAMSKGMWLQRLFKQPTDFMAKIRRALRVLWAIVQPFLVFTLVAWGLLRSGHPFWSAPVPAAAAGFASMVIWVWLWESYLFPWGDLWSLGRPFEANSLSDIILYESDAPRQEIMEKVLDALGPYVPDPAKVAVDPQTRLSVVLAGHSLGSVVIYDMLLAIAAKGLGITTAIEEELGTLGALEKTSRLSPKQTARKVFLKRAFEVIHALRPLGVVTLGSPIAVFLFRKPEAAAGQSGWKWICPPEFRDHGETRGLQWRWRNFWHHCDMVAHRLEPVFNEGFPPGDHDSAKRFVEDVRIQPPVRDPVSAHASYWDHRAVIGRVGAHLAECVIVLDRWIRTP